MKCNYCEETLNNNDHATNHAGECPVMNQEPPDYVLKCDELKEQNKKLIEAVKELIDKTILPLQVSSVYEAKVVREFIEQKKIVLSIISEIEGE